MVSRVVTSSMIFLLAEAPPGAWSCGVGGAGLGAGASRYNPKRRSARDIYTNPGGALPAAAAGRVRISSEPKWQSDGMATKRLENTILVADDSLAQRKLLQAMLQQAGFEVDLVTDGREALEYLQRFTPDLLILDVNMPFMDGISICDRVKRVPRLAGLPVLIITSLEDEKVRNSSRFVKADGFLGKPLDKEQLLHNVSKLLKGEKTRFQQDQDLRATLADTLITLS